MATSIDKVLVNYATLTKFPNLVTIALPDEISDHTPILLLLSVQQNQSKGKPFKYVNN
jgi:hypothetical protein